MGCSGMVGLIISRLIVGLVGLAVRLLSALLLFIVFSLIVPLVIHLLLLVFGWMLISIAALRSPRQAADVIAVRMVDRLARAGIQPIDTSKLYLVFQALAYLLFLTGWLFIVLIFVLIIRIYFG